MIKQIVFDENQKVMQIDMETLEKSADYRNPNEKKFPMSHCDVIYEITEMLDVRNIPYEIDDIFITERGTIPGTKKQIERMNKRILADNPDATDDELVHINDTEVTIIREVIGSIKVLGSFDNEDMGLVIGFNQNEKGLVFGVGIRVKICSNFTIMGANDVFKNYGKDSLPFDAIIELIEKRIDNIEAFWKEQGAFIKALMSITVDAVSEKNYILGELLSMAVKSAYIDTQVESPLNIGEVSKLATNMIRIEDGQISAWELFNHVTAITSKSNKLEGRLLQSAATGKYFIERYGVIGVELNEEEVEAAFTERKAEDVGAKVHEDLEVKITGSDEAKDIIENDDEVSMPETDDI